MSTKRRITGSEYDAIIAALRPTVHELMKRFDLAPTTIGKLAARAGQS